MSERRKVRRKYLMFYTRIFDAVTSGLLGNLIDLTTDGAMIISEAPLPIGKTYRLKLELAGEIGDKPYLEFEATSRWSSQDVDPHFYNTGFHMEKIAPEDAAIIEKIVEAYGFRDN
jgi:hypothetical protein